MGYEVVRRRLVYAQPVHIRLALTCCEGDVARFLVVGVGRGSHREIQGTPMAGLEQGQDSCPSSVSCSSAVLSTELVPVCTSDVCHFAGWYNLFYFLDVMG